MSWPQFWHTVNWKSRLLSPLGRLVCWEAARRLRRFRQAASQRAADGPSVIVVGNLVVGGTGKTPFIVWLGRQLQQRGLRIGIISRGYGGRAKHWPQRVTPLSDAALVGDEPVLLARQLNCPIVVSAKRRDALALLQREHPLDVIISDDGLQHYALPRDIEVVLLDAQRGLGNGLCLPAGPLREPATRLQSVDFIVYNGGVPDTVEFAQKTFGMRLQPACFRQLLDESQRLVPEAFAGQPANALAGIGHPRRFFDTLRRLQIRIEEHAFADHHAFTRADLSAFGDEKPLLMTEKDAVKCSPIAQMEQQRHWWFLEVTPQADDELLAQILHRLDTLKRASK
jgi:tetraacyldisaccharide 4'-kinase